MRSREESQHLPIPPIEVASTVSLRRFLPAPLAWDVRPVARLANGRVWPLTPTFFPPEGPTLLVLWSPGPQDPTFHHVEGRLKRDGNHWIFHGETGEGWVVHSIAQRSKP